MNEHLSPALLKAYEAMTDAPEDLEMDGVLAHWPERVADQRMLLAMIAVWNSKQIRQLRQLQLQAQREHVPMWAMAALALAFGVLALMIYIGIDPILSVVTAIVTGGLGQIVRWLVNR